MSAFARHSRFIAITCKLELSNALTYRASTMMWLTLAGIPIIANYFMWQAVYASGQRTIGGLDFPHIITYQVLAVLMMQGTNPWGLQRTINDEIRNGEISRYLIRPMSYRLYRFMRYMTNNLFYCVIAVFPMALIIVLLGETFVAPEAGHAALAALAFAIGMAIQFLSVYAVAMAAFWLDDIAGLFVSYMMILRFVSGEMFPLDLLPTDILDVLRHTPFPNIIWFPVQVYLGRMSGADLAAGFVNGLLWVALLWAISSFLWRRGIKQYGGFGG